MNWRFSNKLHSYEFSSGQKLVSFDVVSLFTNVPLEETIKLIADELFSEKNSNQPLMKKEMFIELLRLATQGQFLYKDILYKQIDGVTMGSPLGPTIANFFLANLENRILKNKNQHSPNLHLRNVDDVFAVFENNSDCLSFLNVLNSQHKNMKFTLEHSSNFICFLGVKIEINSNSLDTYTWRKPTNTGLLLNFNAFCPQK